MDADTKSAFIAFLVIVILLSLSAVIELYIVAIKKEPCIGDIKLGRAPKNLLSGLYVAAFFGFGIYLLMLYWRSIVQALRK